MKLMVNRAGEIRAFADRDYPDERGEWALFMGPHLGVTGPDGERLPGGSRDRDWPPPPVEEEATSFDPPTALEEKPKTILRKRRTPE